MSILVFPTVTVGDPVIPIFPLIPTVLITLTSKPVLEPIPVAVIAEPAPEKVLDSIVPEQLALTEPTIWR